ncbi:MAG: hypothetical protein LIO59_04500 [Oscillospiraceae bacterium]|nr:hypothetical protein [Oscillospiraceae bacterium]
MFKKIYTTEMSGNKKTVEKRFKAISANKKRGIITGVSVLTAAVIVCGAVWVNGAVSDKAKIYAENETSVTTTEVISQEISESENTQAKNPYNVNSVDITGRTIADVAAETGMTLSKFLEDNGLPADMPGDTYEAAAYGYIPCSKMAEMYGISFEEFKSQLELPDYITESTIYHEAIGEVTLGVYVGTDILEQFKEHYGLGGDVIADTKYKEVADIILEKQRSEYAQE